MQAIRDQTLLQNPKLGVVAATVVGDNAAAVAAAGGVAPATLVKGYVAIAAPRPGTRNTAGIAVGAKGCQPM